MGNIKFEHIRNATSKITYKGITFLIDPMLAPKDAYPGFEGEHITIIFVFLWLIYQIQ